MKNRKNNIGWTPNPGSQSLFVSCPFKEVLYYGTRKAGKSCSLLIDFLQEVGKGYKSAWRGVLLRRTFPQLRDLIIESQILYKKIFPKAEYNKSEGTWYFPDGETLKLSYMFDDRDYTNFHGHSLPWIGWDELCEWPNLEAYELMKSCCFASTPIKAMPRIRATANTWGIGRAEVKSYFIDPVGQWGVPIKNNQGETRIAIFGNMLENIPFMENQGKAYRKALFGLRDKELQKSWIYGSWDVKIGSFFSDVWDERKNVIPMTQCFIPPSDWLCFRSFDWGSASPFSVGWWCESDGNQAPNGLYYPRGTLIRFSEWYGCIREEGKISGSYISNDQIGKEIRKREKEWPHLRIKKGPADTQIFENKGGPNIHDQMGGNLFVEADKTRQAGLAQMRNRMIGTKEEGPGLLVMEWCYDFRRTIPYLQRDDKKLEDIAPNQEDHICLSPNTLVKTLKGFRTIKDLVGTKGKIITVGNFYTDYYNCELTRKNQDLICISFEDGTKIESTLDHKFLDINYNLIQAKDLKIGNYCYSLKGRNRCKSLSLVKQYKNLIELDTIYAKNLEQINIQRLKLVQEIAEQNSAEKIGKRIKSIDYIGKSDVYCLTTKGTHLFAIQGNIIVSNCDESRYACMFRRLKHDSKTMDTSDIIIY